jgi:hypothetical protein
MKRWTAGQHQAVELLWSQQHLAQQLRRQRLQAASAALAAAAG